MISNNDITTRAIEWALGGLEQRSQTIADNVANAETPGFRGSEVSFENELRSALQTGHMDRTPSVSVAHTTNPAGANGNNVRLEDEMVDMIATNLSKSAMIQSFNYKADILRAAIRS